MGDALATIGLQIFAPILGIGASYVIGGIVYLAAALALTFFCIGKDMQWVRRWRSSSAPTLPEPAAEARTDIDGASRRRIPPRWLDVPGLATLAALLAGAYFLFVPGASTILLGDSCNGREVIASVKGMILDEARKEPNGAGSISANQFLRVENIVDDGVESARHHCSATVLLSDDARAFADRN